jgi:PIN domain nuclease of toxin-antitoxin system
LKILLDTCALLWLALDDARFSSKARLAFEDPENEVFLSVVSAWEISLKHSVGKLILPKAPDQWIPERREKYLLATLPLEEAAALHETKLPRLHNDPFDRMLMCQSIVHGMAILTPDPEILKYPVHTLW